MPFWTPPGTRFGPPAPPPPAAPPCELSPEESPPPWACARAAWHFAGPTIDPGSSGSPRAHFARSAWYLVFVSAATCVTDLVLPALAACANIRSMPALYWD